MSVFSKAGSVIRTMQRNKMHKRAGGTGGAPNFSLVGDSFSKTTALAKVRNTTGPMLPAVIENGGAATTGYTAQMSGLVGKGLGFTNGARAIGSYGYNNFRNSIGGDMGDVAKWAAGRAGRGAVVGGAAGGTIEAGQGGSFWSGAKAGAFNGAVGWTAYRGAGKAFANGSKDPFKVAGGFGNSFGMISANGANMTKAAAAATTGQRAQMSKSVQAIMKNQQNTKTAKSVIGS